MFELVLIRHAHAKPAEGDETDMDRALSNPGQVEGWTTGAWLHARRSQPERVLCSPARRTRETMEAVMRSMGPLPMRLEPAIYEASTGELITLVDNNRDADSLWVVGHNPGLEHLVALLADGRTGDYRGMSPGSVAVLHFPKEAEIEPGVATLVDFWSP